MPDNTSTAATDSIELHGGIDGPARATATDGISWAVPCECPDPCPRDHEHE
ncbi:MAG: hypothetical protein H0V51_02305 [Chloroflexi bacterium]|nr:hypothetical protein [Chloroflexota bacterium]